MARSQLLECACWRFLFPIVFPLFEISPTLSLNWQGDPTTCGRRFQPVTSLIVGGEPAAEYAWPWQVALLENGAQVCGASLVDPSWVMTAAHCVNKCFLCEPERYSFLVGSTSLISATNATQERTASHLFVHPDYDSDYDDNDIALFKMSEPFVVDHVDFTVNTVCLPTADMEDQFTAGDDAVVTGWGALEEDGYYPDTLYEARVKIVNQSQCNTSYEGAITENMICAGVPQGGVDSCQGDSGGPLVALKDNSTEQYFLIGVVSFGEGCGLPGYPGVYTRVTRYENWTLPIFNGLILDSYVPCVCGNDRLPSSVIAGLSTLSVLLALSLGVNTFLIIRWCMNRDSMKT